MKQTRKDSPKKGGGFTIHFETPEEDETPNLGGTDLGGTLRALSKPYDILAEFEQQLLVTTVQKLSARVEQLEQELVKLVQAHNEMFVQLTLMEAPDTSAEAVQAVMRRATELKAA